MSRSVRSFLAWTAIGTLAASFAATPARAQGDPPGKAPAEGQPAADTPAPAPAPKGPAAADFDKVFAEWKALLEDVRGLKARYQIAEDAELDGIRKQYNDGIERGRKMLADLRASAIKAYLEAPNADPPLSRLLVKLAADDIRADNYEAAAALTKTLIDNKSTEKEIPDLAGIAAFALHDFEAADKFLNEAATKNALSDAGRNFLTEVDTYKELWKQEQELRAKQAAANDLPRVKLTTTKGDIVLELFENEAPQTVGNFVSLVEKNFYDGLSFHRVLRGFVAQGGDPKGDGSGGPGYNIFCECYHDDHRKHFSGSLSMAHAGKDTGGSQFFITFVPTPGLNGRHTVFGRVFEGMDVLARLQRRDPENPPPLPEPDKIVKAEVLRKRPHEYVPTKVEPK